MNQYKEYFLKIHIFKQFSYKKKLLGSVNQIDEVL